jgi:predicted component of type VI protein secretion system
VRWFLQVTGGEQVGKKFHVQPGSMSFGRSPKSELCFSDPELSRRHCEFFLKDDVLEVKDLASANGVFVNQRKVGTARLKPGDEVRMGSVCLLVIGPTAAGAAVELEAEDDSEATQFVRALDLPRLDKPKTAGARPTANPLRAPAPAPAASVQPEGRGHSPLAIGLVAGGALLLVAGVAAALIL